MQTINLPSQPLTTPILCSYKNNTEQLQVIRLKNSAQGYLERIVFPGEYYLFKAEPQDEVEVYSKVNQEMIESQHLLCQSLQVEEVV